MVLDHLLFFKRLLGRVLKTSYPVWINIGQNILNFVTTNEFKELVKSDPNIVLGSNLLFNRHHLNFLLTQTLVFNFQKVWVNLMWSIRLAHLISRSAIGFANLLIHIISFICLILDTFVCLFFVLDCILNLVSFSACLFKRLLVIGSRSRSELTSLILIWLFWINFIIIVIILTGFSLYLASMQFQEKTWIIISCLVFLREFPSSGLRTKLVALPRYRALYTSSQVLIHFLIQMRPLAAQDLGDSLALRILRGRN